MISRHNQSVPKAEHFLGILCVLAAMLIWSTIPVGTRLLMRDGAFSPAFIAATRLGITALAFVALQAVDSRRRRIPFYTPLKRTGWLCIAAAALCGNLLIYAIGLRFTTASATAVINPVNAITTVLLAALLLGERLTPAKLLGMSLAIAGVLLVVFHRAAVGDLLSTRHLLGNLLELIASSIWAFYAIGQTKLQQESGGGQVLMPIFALAALFSLLLLPVTGKLILHTPNMEDWLVLFTLGAGSTAVAYWLYAAGLQRIETSEGAMFNVLIPPFALLLAHCCLGEPLQSNMLGGLALVVTGLICIVWHRSYSPLRGHALHAGLHKSSSPPVKDLNLPT